MKKYISLTVFCLALTSLSQAGDFSWAKYVSKDHDLGSISRTRIGEGSARRKDLKKRTLNAVDPNSFRFKDHRRKKVLNVLVFGDSGTGKEDQYLVAQRMYEECQKEGCDFSIITGDIIYPTGFSNSRKGERLSRKDHYQVNKKFELPYQQFKSFDFWLTPGNHDWYGDLQQSINYTQKSVRWKMPYNHYELPWLPRWIRMYGLDTTRWERLDTDSGLVAQQMERANKRYASGSGLADEQKNSFCSSNGWKILFGHHGIYTSGRHGRLDMAKPYRILNPFRQKGENKNMKKKLLPFIKKCGVQLFLVGHDHHQEHIKAFDRKTKKLVFHQILQGAGGMIRKTYKTKHPEFKTLAKSSMFGFSILTFTPDKVRVRYYGYPKGKPADFKMYHDASIYKKDYR